MSQLEVQDAFEPYYADTGSSGNVAARDSDLTGAHASGDLKSCRYRLLAVRERLANLLAKAVEPRH